MNSILIHTSSFYEQKTSITFFVGIVGELLLAKKKKIDPKANLVDRVCRKPTTTFRHESRPNHVLSEYVNLTIMKLPRLSKYGGLLKISKNRINHVFFQFLGH